MDRKIDFTAELADATRYQAQINKLFEKLKLNKQLFTTEQQGVKYFSIGLHEAEMATLLRNAVLEENYLLQPAKAKTLVIKAKSRKVFLFSQTDKLVISTVMQLLTELAEHKLSDDVYSYRRGKTTTQPVAKLAKLIANQKSDQKSGQHADKSFHPRALYVFKTDFADYSDHVKLNESSVLWQQLRQLFIELCQNEPTAYQWQLIKSCFRPVYYNAQGNLQCNTLGLPVGTSSNTLGCNLYSIPLDEVMQQFPGLFYARFSDDIILAHTDRAIISQAINVLHCKVNELGLKIKPQKEQRLYVNNGAVACEEAPEWRACNKFTYLGYDIYGSGSFLISTARQRKLLTAITSRINATAQLLQHKDNTTRGKAICKVVNVALQDENFAENEVLHLVQGNNRDMLRHFDYLIALRIAEAITQLKGPRAFRYIPYHSLREEWHLLSLVQLSFR